METRQSRVLRVAPVVPFLVLLLGCSKAGTDPQGGVQDAAVPSTTGAANASSATTADRPLSDGGGATPPAASEHLPALEVCQRVVAAKIAKACQAMPPVGAATGAAQFTAPGTPARQQDLFGAVFTYAAAADHDKALAAFGSEPVGAKRAPPAILSNAGALTILVADGELRPADIASLKAMVAGLR